MGLQKNQKFTELAGNVQTVPSMFQGWQRWPICIKYSTTGSHYHLWFSCRFLIVLRGSGCPNTSIYWSCYTFTSPELVWTQENGIRIQITNLINNNWTNTRRRHTWRPYQLYIHNRTLKEEIMVCGQCHSITANYKSKLDPRMNFAKGKLMLHWSNP